MLYFARFSAGSKYLLVSTLTPGLAGSVKAEFQRGEVSNTVIPGMALTPLI